MNITELARQVKLSTKDLRAILPRIGFDIGGRAIKVDDRVASDVISILSKFDNRKKYLDQLKAAAPGEVIEPEKAEETPGDIRVVNIPPAITVKALAVQLNMPITKLIMELMQNGIMAAQNERIDYETAAIISEDHGFSPKQADAGAENAEVQTDLKVFQESEQGTTNPRPPVIVVMGHVDHGKTKLLDAIRRTNIVDTESGGITQHIGAYQVVRRGKPITFIDTPGHEAFTAMRSRGAKVADIAILVVAADDGVQPQTIEALSHIQRAELPFLVAINKIDKEGVNIDKVKQDLAQLKVQAEDWGGKIPMQPISAKKGLHIDELLDTVLLVADMEAEKIVANPNRPAVGTIIESHVDKGEGPVATVLVQLGTLRQGDYIKVGEVTGKVKVMKDYLGQSMSIASPSVPAKIVGFKELPDVGGILQAFSSEKEFKVFSRKTKKKSRASDINASAKPREIADSAAEQDYNLVIKADVVGSIEAIQEALEKAYHAEIKINFVKTGLGPVTEKDVEQALGQQARVLGFNVVITPAAEKLALDTGVDVKTYRVIYDLVDYAKAEIESLLTPETVRQDLGSIEILAVFRHSKDGTIAGGKVLQGKVMSDSLVEVDGAAGRLTELQSGKENVTEVVEGQECGLKIEGLEDLKVGARLQVYREEKIKKKVGG